MGTRAKQKTNASATDVASLRLNHESTPEQFARFCGAIETAWRLGYDVTLRIVDDPYAQQHGRGSRPLDIYAEARPARRRPATPAED